MITPDFQSEFAQLLAKYGWTVDDVTMRDSAGDSPGSWTLFIKLHAHKGCP